MDVMYGLEWEWSDESSGGLPTLCSLIGELEERELIPANPVVRREGSRGRRLSSAAQLAKESSDWDTGAYYVSQHPERQEFDLSVVLGRKSSSLGLHLGGSELQRQRGRLVTTLDSVTRNFIGRHRETVIFRAGSGLSIRDLTYPQVRPPRHFQLAGRSSVLDVVDERFWPGRGKREALERLRRHVLPPGATRDQMGPVLIIRWASDVDLLEERLLRGRLSAREQWLVSAVDPPIRDGWNQEGEVQADPVAAEAHPPLTLYSPPLAVGYKALHSAAGEDAVAAELDRLATWLKDGRLEDGTPLTNAVVIVESRDAAHALRPKALERGIRHIVYVGEDGHMWDPFPAGEWV